MYASQRLHRLFSLILLLIVGPFARANPISTVGLNLYGDSPEYHAFWKACGYNTAELLDVGWWYSPAQHTSYYTNLAAQITRLHQDGFKAYVILLSNMAQWPGPAATAPSDYLTRFDPTAASAMVARLDYLRQAIIQLHAADGFIFLAGDPGGNSPDFSTTSDQFIAMARQVRDLVYTHAGPTTDFIVNAWAISYWIGTPTSAAARQLWDEQILGTQAIVDAADLIGSLTGANGRRVGMAFTLDNYYRPLALTTYAQQPAPPMQLYPLAATVTALAQRPTPQQWGWPYFLLDEADGGYLSNGQPQSEVRYIRQCVEHARQLGLNGLIGNVSYAGRAAEALNTYAFARFCLPTTATTTLATVADVFAEFSGFVATPETAGLLGQVLRFVENRSTWHASLPEANRLPALDDGQTSTAWRALVRLQQVQPNPAPVFPLPEPPAEYLRRMHAWLRQLAAAETDKALTTSSDSESGELFGLSGGNWTGDQNLAGGLDADLGSPSDRAALVVSTDATLTGFPGRWDQPLELRRSHAPSFIRVGIRKNPLQSSTAELYWDDVLLGTINASTAAGDALAVVELPLSPELQTQSALFTKGTHLLTLQVASLPGTGRYFEVDALWLADTSTRYDSGYRWDLLSDYEPTAALLDDAGSARLASNAGLSRAAPGAALWRLGYMTQQPFNPATMAFVPAYVAPLSTDSLARVYGAAHVQPDTTPGAEIGRISAAFAESFACPPLSIYLHGIGSKPIPQVGTSVSPAIIGFTVPRDGLYGVDISLKGRAQGWHAAATLYRGAAILGARQTSYNGTAMHFVTSGLALHRGEQLFLVVEGMSNDSWSEVILNGFTVQLQETPRSTASPLWNAY
jgi:hypothetical protein